MLLKEFGRSLSVRKSRTLGYCIQRTMITGERRGVCLSRSELKELREFINLLDL